MWTSAQDHPDYHLKRHWMFIKAVCPLLLFSNYIKTFNAKTFLNYLRKKNTEHRQQKIIIKILQPGKYYLNLYLYYVYYIVCIVSILCPNVDETVLLLFHLPVFIMIFFSNVKCYHYISVYLNIRWGHH